MRRPGLAAALAAHGKILVVMGSLSRSGATRIAIFVISLKVYLF